MKKFKAQVKANSTCPMKATVLSAIDEGKASFKSVIGEEKLRGMFPVYVDEIAPENLFGFLSGVSSESGKTVLDADEIDVLVKKHPSLGCVSYSGNIIDVSLLLEDAVAADVQNDGKMSKELEDLVDSKIAEGILTKEDWELKYQEFKKNKVSEELIIDVVMGYRKYNKAVHRPRCMYVDPFLNRVVDGKDGIVAKGLRFAALRQATICQGEKSVGKNVYMEYITWLLNMPLYMVCFSRQMSPSAIYGEKSTDNSASEQLKNMHREASAKVMLDAGIVKADDRLKAIDAAADFELQKARAASVSIIVDASDMYDWMVDGGVMVWNEANMADANLLSQFANPLTDGTGFLFFPGRGEIEMNPDCVLFGTQNADYEGTQQQNSATMSRFNCLDFVQPETVVGQLTEATKSEMKKIGREMKLSDKYFEQAQKFYTQIMKAVHSGTITNNALNIRGFVRALTICARYNGRVSLKEYLYNCVVALCPTDEVDALNAILQATVTL